jgi:hypothetical protein
MEDFIVRTLTQAPPLASESLSPLCKYWDSLFWLGFVVGIVGAVIFFFMRPTDSA